MPYMSMLWVYIIFVEIIFVVSQEYTSTFVACFYRRTKVQTKTAIQSFLDQHWADFQQKSQLFQPKPMIRIHDSNIPLG